MKKIASFLSVLIIISVFMTTAVFADSPTPYIASHRESLSFQTSGGKTTAVCYSFVQAGANKSIHTNMELWQGNSFLTSWSQDGSYAMEMRREYPVVKGKSYTLKITVTVDGKTLGSWPLTRTC